MTLLTSYFWSEACFQVKPEGPLKVKPAAKTKARGAVERLLSEWNIGDIGGELTITSNIPVRWGLGSSTADIVAAVSAVADALGRYLPAEAIARLAVDAEVASDPTMFSPDRAVLFAQRDGVVLEDFGRPLPALDVLGFLTDATGNGVDTTTFPLGEYNPWEVETFGVLWAALRRSIGTNDPFLLGRVATASARINERFLPVPRWSDLERLVGELPALGIQVSHSGCVGGVLFNPADPDLAAKHEVAVRRLADLGFEKTWHFATGSTADLRENTA